MKLRTLIYYFVLGYFLGCAIGAVASYAFAENALSVYPVSNTVSVGETFDVQITLSPDDYVKGWELKVVFDADMLTANTVSSGDFFQDYLTMFNPGIIDNVNGTILNIYGLIIGREGNISDDGSIVVISFTADALGTTEIGLYDTGIVNESRYLPMTVGNGTVVITEKDGDGGVLPLSTDDDGSFSVMDVFVPIIMILFVLGMIVKIFT